MMRSAPSFFELFYCFFGFKEAFVKMRQEQCNPLSSIFAKNGTDLISTSSIM
jgi:hypothetical protein